VIASSGFGRQNKWIFSICHGIQILVAPGSAAAQAHLLSQCQLELEYAGGVVDRQRS
jgi:putative intracellular protease/amidase